MVGVMNVSLGLLYDFKLERKVKKKKVITICVTLLLPFFDDVAGHSK